MRARNLKYTCDVQSQTLQYILLLTYSYEAHFRTSEQSKVREPHGEPAGAITPQRRRRPCALTTGSLGGCIRAPSLSSDPIRTHVGLQNTIPAGANVSKLACGDCNS